MNSIVVFGRVTKDIELKATPTGIYHTRFNLASKSSVRDENGEYKTNFFICLAWRDKAERLHKFVKKGDQLVIKGTINSRDYDKNGEPVSVWEVNVEDFSFVSGENAEKTPKELTPIEDDDNLPF